MRSVFNHLELCYHLGMKMAVISALAFFTGVGPGFCAQQQQAPQQVQVELQNITVKPGDTLWSISQKYLKDPTKWNEILAYNKLPSSDITVALPGMTLRIPISSVKAEFQAARLFYRLNSVFYKRSEGGEWTMATDNMQVFRNDNLKTMANSKAGVRFLDGDLMEVGPDSWAVVSPPAKGFQIELKRGTVVAANKTIKVGSAIVTPGSANTVYTATVKADNTTVVQVYKGQAAVAAAGKTVQVGAGKLTEIKEGLAPSVAIDIPDMGNFSSLVSGFMSKLNAIKKSVADVIPAKEIEVVTDYEKADEAKEALMKEANRLKLLEAISGHRVECSQTKEFEVIVAKKFFEEDETIDPYSFNLAPGEYWCRMAPVDLLGVTGRFREPKKYFLGGKR